MTTNPLGESIAIILTVEPLPFKYNFVAGSFIFIVLMQGAIAGVSEILVMYPLDG